MARRANAPKSPKAPPKAPKAAAKAAPADGTGGSLMFKLLLYLAILGGVGYAASRVPIGGKTVFEHGRDVVKWESVAKKGAELGRAAGETVAKAVSGAVAKDEAPAKATGPAKAPPAKTAPPPAVKPAEKTKAKPKVAVAERAPADEHTRAEREALDRLLR